MLDTMQDGHWVEVQWLEASKQRKAAWNADSGKSAPRKIIIADDTLSADSAFRLVSEGTSLLWRGDFQNARHLIDALARRLEKKPRRSDIKKAATQAQTRAAAGVGEFPHAFHLHRQTQAQRARVLGSVLIELDTQWHCKLRRAPDWSQACNEAWGKPAIVEHGLASVLVPLRDLIGALGAHEWRKKGLELPVLNGQHIHAHYGVFSPVRGEYLDLVAKAPLPAAAKNGAWDIGVGTGVLTALLLQRGVETVVATDLSDRALACAGENLQRLNLTKRVQLLKTDLFAPGKAGLIVCNPPWLPGKATTWLEQAVYDEDSRMLRGYLAGLAEHLLPAGEGWLILSDLAEHLQLRSRDQLLEWIKAAGLEVIEKLDTKPSHGKAFDAADPLFAARSQEVTSLWRLRAL